MGGQPKGLELVGGVRIIDRVVNAISAVTRVSILAANDDMAHDWLHGVSLASDVFPNAGGLAGVHAALLHGEDVLVVAWDMPFVAADLLKAILDRADSSGAAVVIPESNARSMLEPFCGFYGKASLPAIEAFLRTGGGPAHAFLGAMPGLVRLPLAEVGRFGRPEHLFFSVNTPADLERARAIADGSQ